MNLLSETLHAGCRRPENRTHQDMRIHPSKVTPFWKPTMFDVHANPLVPQDLNCS